MLRVILICLAFWLMIFNECNAQEANELHFLTRFTVEEYLADLTELANSLTSKHPKPYEFISKEAFWQMVESKKEMISAETTYPAFIWMCSEIVASIGCGHTNMIYFNQESKVLPTELMMPLDAQLVEGRLFVTEPYTNKGILSVGDEISAINGIDIETIKAGIYKHISSDGYNLSGKQMQFNGFFSFYIPYYLGFPTSYEVNTNKQSEAIRLQQLDNWRFEPISLYPSNCRDAFCAEILEDKKTAMLTINTFYFEGRSEKFFNFLENSFNDFRQKDIQSLVIDLRKNGGGRSSNAFQLLRYFAKNNFTYFDAATDYNALMKEEVAPFENAFGGKVYILTSNANFSSVNHFLSVVKQYGWATMVGEETGSTYTCNDDSEYYKLGHTGISIRNATRTFATTADDFPTNRGILPDHHVVQTITDYQNAKDAVLEYTLDMIEQD
ncbi:MAG: S41 family peptidase [Bacteroidota bacterium]